MHLEDLSVGGCGGFLKRSLLQFNIPLHQIELRFDLQLNNEIITLHGLARYELSNNPDRSLIAYRIGIEFFEVNNLHRSILNQEVLRIERDQIRKELENKRT
jgi:c-di-GMP-binding flagellar brake protein YcgR